LLYDSKQPDSTFWELFRKVLGLLQRCEAPRPDTDFPAFVDRLYLVRDRISFTTVEDLALLAEAVAANVDPDFWLWRLPARVDNPLLFFETLSFLHASGSRAWNRFIGLPGSLDQLFDRYLAYLSYVEKQSTDRLTPTLQFLTTLFVDKYKELTHFGDVAEKFWARVIPLVGLSEGTIAVGAFRTATFLFSITRCKFPADHHEEWLLELVVATQSPSIVHVHALNFVLQAKVPNFKYLRLAAMIVAQGMKEIADYAFLKKLLMLPQMEKPLGVLQSLVMTAINDKLFGRTAALILKEPLARFSDLQALVTWGTLFVRRAFTFIGLAAAAGKYRAKRTRILALFEGLQDVRIEWMNKMVIRYYASLVNSDRIPHNMVGLPREKITDFKFLNEVDQVPRQSVNLKVFLGHIGDTDVPASGSKVKTKPSQKSVPPTKRAPIVSRNAKSPNVRKPMPVRPAISRSHSSGRPPFAKI
jgi:hypothetical protein